MAPLSGSAPKGNKSFLVLFFKKEHFSFFLETCLIAA
jgi:hypothetical protein